MIKVPKKTSVYKTEPRSNKYEMGFAPELIKFIIKGQKIKTFRFGKEKDYLEIGDVITARNTVTKEKICLVKILSKNYKRFCDIPYNYPGHETYSDKEEQRKVFSGYYAFLGRAIRDNDIFIVFEFKKV